MNFSFLREAMMLYKHIRTSNLFSYYCDTYLLITAQVTVMIANYILLQLIMYELVSHSPEGCLTQALLTSDR